LAGLTSEKRREAVLLLATRRTEISEVEGMLDSLIALKLVECSDGIFRVPTEVYFSSQIITEVLGANVAYAAIPAEL
jgi:hypothetical protein